MLGVARRAPLRGELLSAAKPAGRAVLMGTFLLWLVLGVDHVRDEFKARQVQRSLERHSESVLAERQAAMHAEADALFAR
eukprot:268096-Prymnesium_polylepis.1